jgi:acetyl-CoA acetyltransferase
MSIRGKAAIVGFGEIPTRRALPGRSATGLLAEVAKLALDSAHLQKQDINGVVTIDGAGNGLAEYIDIYPRFATGVQMAGASGATTIAVAAAAIEAGYADTILCAISLARDVTAPPVGAGGGTSMGSEFESFAGPAVAANNGYGLLYQRHMYEYGTTAAQMARMAVNQRFNALENPNSAFQGQPISVDDVLNSRYTNEPLHLLECVMPCAGAEALIVTTAERAKAMPNRPVYILGSGIEMSHAAIWQNLRMTQSPTKVAAANSFKMAGYRPADMQFAQFYD